MKTPGQIIADYLSFHSGDSSSRPSARKLIKALDKAGYAIVPKSILMTKPNPPMPISEAVIQRERADLSKAWGSFAVPPGDDRSRRD